MFELQRRERAVLVAAEPGERDDGADIAPEGGERSRLGGDVEVAWLDADGPAILDVPVSRMELVMPPRIEAGQVASTALFGFKAVLNGRASEVVSLLRDNFLR